MRLASPCSDLALFVYISVDPEVYEGDGLDNLLKLYYSTLTEALDAMGVTDPWKGNFKELKDEFIR
jgi:hypothetical protein